MLHRNLSASTPTLCLLALAFLGVGIVATGCSSNQTCRTDDDCFSGQTCTDNVCTPADDAGDRRDSTAPPDTAAPDTRTDGSDTRTDASTDTEPTDTGCESGATRRCEPHDHACPIGEQTCDNGSWSPCMPLEEQEICDGLDNDCDDEVDENLGGDGAPGDDCDYDCHCRGLCDDDGKCTHRVFVTGEIMAGAMGSESSPDEVCAEAVDASGLPATPENWRALVSDPNTPVADRLDLQAGLSNLCQGGQMVSRDATLWSDSLLNPISCAADGMALADVGTTAVWTGTNLDGSSVTSANTCQGWTTTRTDEKGRTGNFEATDEAWLEHETVTCNNYARLYCIEQP